MNAIVEIKSPVPSVYMVKKQTVRSLSRLLRNLRRTNPKSQIRVIYNIQRDLSGVHLIGRDLDTCKSIILSESSSTCYFVSTSLPCFSNS